MLPHGAKRSFHFAREGTLVAHCGRCHARAQSATQVVQAPWIAGERDGDIDILLSIRRAWGNRESNFAQASKVAVDTLAGLLNDPKVTVPVFRQGGGVGSGPSLNPR